MANGYDSARVLVFAKAPIPGRAKTRLEPALGASGAAALHARLTHWTVEHALRSRATVELWCADDPGHPFYRTLAEMRGIPLHRQSGRDLGERMSSALSDALTRACAAIVIGTDCPGLGPEHLDIAARLLLRHACDLVLGPALDGGYVLIGTHRPQPELFDSMPWGSNLVLEETRARLERLGLSWHELEPLADIDRPADLVHLPEDLRFDSIGEA